MIQDIAPHRLVNAYDPAARPGETDFVLAFREGKALLRAGERPAFLRRKEFPADCSLTYLFTVDASPFYLCTDETAVPLESRPWGMRELRGAEGLAREDLFAIFTAKHLADWYRDTRFCGRCGKPMTHSATERAMQCTCGYTAYPRIMPAVIVGVKNGDSILLTKYRTGFAYNALIAGFTEIGETAEQTVAREVFEETGVRVKNITYYKSQPWGVANDLLLGYYCDLDGDPAITMDPCELKYAAWVRREDIELQPDDTSLTNEMMKMFKTGEIR